jgi:hypothetical protein
MEKMREGAVKIYQKRWFFMASSRPLVDFTEQFL